ncbi:MAG: NAD(P)H-binding protein [Acidimicrobiia bacterium]|nr:NAD(P)H-binding protein [Acidimicrobiia bacterium]
MSGLHVVLGAGGGLGRAIAAEAASRGLPVRAVNRGGDVDLPGVAAVAADVETADGAARAVNDAGVVYMAAQPPYHEWPGRFPGMLRTVVDATAAAGARLVMVDNLYGYGPDAGPMSEAGPERATDAKGRTRREMTGLLLAADREGRLPVLIGRLSDYFGPHGDNSTVSALAVIPGAAGKPIRWPGSLDAPHSVAYLPDAARAFVTLAATPSAWRRIWVLPHAPAVTGGEILGMVNRALPRPVKTARLGMGLLRLAAPFHRPSREILGIGYQFTAPFVADDAAFRQAFPEFAVTPLDRAMAETVAWYRSRLAA